MKINFIAQGYVSDDMLARNEADCYSRGLPIIGSAPVKPRLAVIGGGPSVANHLDELEAWDGDIWAINGAFRWCRENGIDAAFYSIDPSPLLIGMAKGAKRAILASHCDPGLFDAIDGPIEVFPMGELPSGSTTACTAPMAAAKRGHSSVTLFGCDSSFHGRMHVYSWGIEGVSQMEVSCGGRNYLTSPQMVMQAEYLAEIARGVPGFLTVAGDGFLPALIEHGDYDVTAVSRGLMESLHGNQQLQ